MVGGALAVLLALAALALLSLFGGHPQPTALAQLAPSQTSVPSPPFTSPLRSPTPTATRRPRPTPVAMEPITDAREIAALRARYRGILDSEPPSGAPPRSPLVVSATAPARAYLPLILSGPAWKGVGDAAYSDVSALDVSWWYDWQHWKIDSGAFATALPGRLDRYVPMIWCANRPEDGILGDTGVLSAPWNPPVIATRAARHPGRVWLVFNEPDFPMVMHAITPTPSGAPTYVFHYEECGRYLCNMLGRIPLPPGVDAVAWFVTGYSNATVKTWLLEMTATPTWPPPPTPSPTRINMYTGTPASTPRVPLGAQWTTYPPDRFPPTSTPGP